MESSLKLDEFSEMSPYDETTAYQIQKVFPIKSPNQVKSVRFLNDMGEEAHIPKQSTTLSPVRVQRENPLEQLVNEDRPEEYFNSIQATVDL